MRHAQRSKHASVMLGLGRPLFHLLSTTYLVLIYGLPLVLAALILERLWSSEAKWLALVLAPFFCAVVMTAVSGLLSLPHQKAIVAGTFPRDLNCRIYFHRRLYGTCWTTLYYCKPAYFLILAIAPLRKCAFRLFGYRGCLDFTIYPDTWIRDLPLLNFGEGAYIANRATLGSNICLQSGEILVGPISIGARSVVGHLGVIGLGSTMAADSELGVGVAAGIHVSIGRNTKIGAISGLNAGSNIGNDCAIGAMSYVGFGTRVLDGAQLPGASISADHLVIESKIHNPTDAPELDHMEDWDGVVVQPTLPDTATPASVEGHYRACSYVKEICVLSPNGEPNSDVAPTVHAVIVPDIDVARARGIANVGEVIRFALDTLSARLPETRRISTYEVWLEPLPRTGSGDLDRAAITRRVQESLGRPAGLPRGYQRELSEADKAWCGRPEVQRALEVLRAKVPRSIYHPDDNLEFDLGLDSMERVLLLLALENELGGSADNRGLAEAYTIRELVNRTLEGESSRQEFGGWQTIFDSQLSPEDIQFFNASEPFRPLYGSWSVALSG
jgi:carbonic anhydrase/acetyltransferase-like protein (isoleucine patch superfamily)/acyl carrier protein